MKNYFRLIGLIGIGIFIYLMSTINLNLLLDSFKSMNYTYLLISILFIVPEVIINTAKWLVVIDKKDRLSLPKGIFAWVAGYGIGMLTPGKLGEFTKVKFLKSKPGKSFLTILVDRLNDIFVLFILGIFAVFSLFLNKTHLSYLSYLFLAFFVLFIIGIFFLRNEKLIKKIGMPFYKLLVPKKYKSFAGENINIFYKNIEKMNKKNIFINFLLTVLVWFVCFAQHWFLSLSLGLNLSYFSICLIAPILILVQLIPISISGIGTREAAAVLLLSTFGISPELAIAFSLGILIEEYILGGIGLLCWLKVK
ncbi:MAG: flippase-like domain-containing protein [Candidatus Aenigmarchaeota archaeon]|nr:flippase-like domain-containing protein [Candidatus Aenigmarchaeota archaeon]